MYRSMPHRPAPRTPQKSLRVSSDPPSASPLRTLLLLKLLLLICQLLLLRFLGRPLADFFIAVEIHRSVDQHLLHLGVIRKGVLVVNHEVGVLADIDGSHTVVD